MTHGLLNHVSTGVVSRWVVRPEASHPLNRMLDKVSTDAADQGSLGIEESTDGKSAYARDYEREHGETTKENINGGTEASTIAQQ